jgi:hypothetical protein
LVTGSVIPAVFEAADNAITSLLTVATTEPGSTFGNRTSDDLAFESGRVFAKADGPAKGVPFSDLFHRTNMRLVTGNGKSEGTLDEKKPKVSMHSYGCHFVEITWQPAIARLRVNRVVTAIDGGRIINPLAGRNQIEGAVVMGIGMALLEHTTYDPQNGAPINSNLADYIVAVNADVPKLEVRLLDYPGLELNAVGARGNRSSRYRGCDYCGDLSCHRRTRARTADKNRGPADVVNFDLTNESTSADHQMRRRKPFAAVGSCDVGSDGRFYLSKTGSSPFGGTGRQNFRRSERRMFGRGNWPLRTRSHRQWFTDPAFV